MPFTILLQPDKLPVQCRVWVTGIVLCTYEISLYDSDGQTVLDHFSGDNRSGDTVFDLPGKVEENRDRALIINATFVSPDGEKTNGTYVLEILQENEAVGKMEEPYEVEKEAQDLLTDVKLK